MSKDIDEIWKEMKAMNAPVRTKQEKQKTQKLPRNNKPCEADISGRGVNLCKDLQHKSEVKVDEVTAKQILTMIQRDLNCLADENKAVRKRAAIALHQQLVESCTLTSEMKIEIFEQISKPLMKRFNDPVEKVRELVIGLCTEFIRDTPHDLMQILPYIYPAIMNLTSPWHYDEASQEFVSDKYALEEKKRGRIPEKNKNFSFRQERDKSAVDAQIAGEPSEEIRLLLCQLLEALLKNVFDRQAASLLHPYFFDTIIFLVGGLHDRYPDVNACCCTLIQLMIEHMASGMKHFAVALARTSKHLLRHRHARIRGVALEAISRIVSCPHIEKCKGAGTEAIADLLGHIDENVIPVAAFYRYETTFNYFAALDQDPSPQVRRSFYNMIASWLLHLPDRYDHESRLMPYLLSSLNDSCPEIAASTLETIQQLGLRYEEEHPDDVRERQQYGVDGDIRCNYSLPLPAPFTSRPRLGARLYVRSRCRRFIKTLLNELNNWMSKTRLHAARLLKSIIIFSEEHITMDYHQILQTLMETMQIQIHSEKYDPELRIEIDQIANLIGRFIAPDTYLPFFTRLFPIADESPGSEDREKQIVGLMVLAEFVGGSLSSQIFAQLPQLSATFSSWSVLEYENPEYQAALAKFCWNLLQTIARETKGSIQSAHFQSKGRLVSEEQIYRNLARILIIQQKRSSSPETNAECWKLLQKQMQLQTCTQVHEKFSKDFISDSIAAYPSHLELNWKATCPQHLLLNSCVENAAIDVWIEHASSLIELALALLHFTSTKPISTFAEEIMQPLLLSAPTSLQTLWLTKVVGKTTWPADNKRAIRIRQLHFCFQAFPDIACDGIEQVMQQIVQMLGQWQEFPYAEQTLLVELLAAYVKNVQTIDPPLLVEILHALRNVFDHPNDELRVQAITLVAQIFQHQLEKLHPKQLEPIAKDFLRTITTQKHAMPFKDYDTFVTSLKQALNEEIATVSP